MKTNKQLLSAAILITGLFSSTTLLAAPSYATGNAEQAEVVSQMVNLIPHYDDQRPGYDLCPLSGQFWFHMKVNSNATHSEFSIPAGYSFVITGVDSYMAVYIESDTNSETLISGGASESTLSDIVVRPGVKICANNVGNIHGHLEKDN